MSGLPKKLAVPIEVSALPDRLPKDDQEKPPSEVIMIGKDSKHYVKRDGKILKLT